MNCWLTPRSALPSSPSGSAARTYPQAASEPRVDARDGRPIPRHHGGHRDAASRTNITWNDDVIAMNQFAGVLTSATEAIASGMDTRGQGVPARCLQPAEYRARRRSGSARGDHFPAWAMPNGVQVIGPDGKEVPSQVIATVRSGKISVPRQSRRRSDSPSTTCRPRGIRSATRVSN